MSEPSFIGRPNAAWHAGGFALGRWAADRWGDAVEPHGHETGHFMLVIGGRYRTEARPGHGAQPLLVYNPPGTWHRDRFEGPGLFFSIELDAARSREAASFGLPAMPTRLGTPRAQAAMRRILRACANRRTEAMEGLCLELFGETGRQYEESRPAWLERTLDRLRAAPLDAAPIAALAAEAGVHPVHLARGFRRHCGTTPGEFQVALRLAAAAEALRAGSQPIAEIALDCGFADQSHLSHRFRDLYGLPPAAYRRMFV